MSRSDDEEPAAAIFPDYYYESIQVVPGYQPLFGKWPTKDELIAILNHYPLLEWLSFLSRLQVLLTPPNHANPAHIAAAYKGVVGPTVDPLLRSFLDGHGGLIRSPVFCEPQMSTLQQLAFMHAPASGRRAFNTPQDFDNLSIALLMTWDLMHGCQDPNGHHDTLAAIVQDLARQPSEPLPVMAARAFHVYQLDRSAPSPTAARLRALFREATGAEVADYVLGGLAIAVKEQTQSLEHLAAGWSATLNPTACSNPFEARCLDAYHRVRCGTVEQVQAAISKFDGDRSIEQFSLIGVRSHPLVELGPGRRFVVNLPAVVSSLFDGIRHVILATTVQRQLNLTVQELGGIYGDLFEEYVLEHLQQAFGGRLFKIPHDHNNRRADALIIYPNRVVIVEIKGKYPRAIDYQNPMTFRERQQQFARLGVADAAEQLAQTIRALRANELRYPGSESVDWTVTSIIPVIVSIESLPQTWQMRDLYVPALGPLNSLPRGLPCTSTRFLGVDDVERLPDLVRTGNFGQLLQEWADDRQHAECTLNNYVYFRRGGFDCPLLKDRQVAVYRFLVNRFNLDASKVNWGGFPSK